MSSPPGPAVIEVALNGATSKSDNRWVPIEPDEIATDAIACLDRGAAIVHSHADRYGVPPDEIAGRYLEAWLPVWARRPEALLYPTAHAAVGDGGFDHQDRLVEHGLRIGLFEAGSVNLGAFTYLNSESDIDRQGELCARLELGPSVSVFEPGFLRAALRRWNAGTLPRGAWIKLYFCGDAGYVAGQFGMPPSRRALEVYLDMMDGCPLPWSVAVLGGDIVETGMAAVALERGGHVRTGIEDYGGPDAPTNLELLDRLLEVCEAVGRRPASCVEASALFDLPRDPTGT